MNGRWIGGLGMGTGGRSKYVDEWVGGEVGGPVDARIAG